MRVLFTETFARQLEAQISYIAKKASVDVAHRMKDRVLNHVFAFLSANPEASRFIQEHAIFESVIPNTNYVLFYRLEEPDILRILALFHDRQQRSDFGSDI